MPERRTIPDWNVDTLIDLLRFVTDGAERLAQIEKDLLTRLEEGISRGLFRMYPWEAQEWLSSLYWADRRLAIIVRSVYHKRREEWEPKSFTPDPIEIAVKCQSCGGKFFTQCTSWTDYRRAVGTGKNDGCQCEGCRAEREEERKQEHAQWKQELAARKQAITELRAMPYAQYLTTDHWQEVRKVALKRAGWRCQLCNCGGELHVHHRTYDNLGHEERDDLLVLCSDCHAKHHDIIIIPHPAQGSKVSEPRTSHEHVQLLTAAEVMERLRVSRSTFWHYVKLEKVPQPMRVGSLVRWRLRDIERFVGEKP